MTLAEFEADEDPNKWWRLSTGEMENLYDQAIEERDKFREALEAILKHQEAMGGAISEYSVTAIIAREAINKIDKV